MCICSFSTFFLNTSEWLLPMITVIFPLFWIFFGKKTTLQENGYKASVNLRQFVIIKALYNDRYSRWNMSNHMLSKGEKKNKKNWSILMSSQDNAIEVSRDLQLWRSSFGPFKHIYYFQFLIFEIIHFVVWFYVLSVIFPRLIISLNFVRLICF